MEKLIKEGYTHLWYELAMNHVLGDIIARPVFTNGKLWIEVDTPEGYENAKKIFRRIVEKCKPFCYYT